MMPKVAELVDAHVSKVRDVERRAGSTPVLGTRNPVRVSSDGVLHFLCPHRVRNLSGTTKIETCPWLLRDSREIGLKIITKLIVNVIKISYLSYRN